MFSVTHPIKTLAYFQNFAPPTYSNIQVAFQKKQDQMKQKSKHDQLRKERFYVDYYL